jgi:hypothetical protein
MVMKMRLLLLGVLLLGGCSGGGGSPPGSFGNEVLHWEQPPLFADNTPMDVRREVSRWDIYCTFFPFPSDNDLVASIATPDNLSFNLALLRAYGIEPGPDGQLIFLKCVGIDNEASDFSAPTEWRN